MADMIYSFLNNSTSRKIEWPESLGYDHNAPFQFNCGGLRVLVQYPLLQAMLKAYSVLTVYPLVDYYR